LKIEVHFFGPIRRPSDKQKICIEINNSASVSDLLYTLGFKDKETQRVAVVIEGKRKKLTDKLNPNDLVRLVLLAGGG